MPEQIVSLPPVEALRGWLRHEDGRLYWQTGPRAGKEAGCRSAALNRVLVRLCGRGGPLVPRYRVIWALVHGAWPVGELDHADCDSMNDRPGNLRAATSSQNKWNQRIGRRNTSGFKGVYWHAQSGKWAASIGRPSRYLGVFATPDAAHAAYMAAAQAAAGEFARAA